MKEKETSENIGPIFTGDHRRDTSVSDCEKAVEASMAIYNMIIKKAGARPKKKDGEK